MKQETLLVSAKLKHDEYYTHYDTIAAEFDKDKYNDIWTRDDTIAHNCFGTYELNKAQDIVKYLDYRVDLHRFVIKQDNKYKNVFYRFIIQKK